MNDPTNANPPEAAQTPQPQLLTQAEACAFLRIGRTKMTQLRNRGLIPIIRVGKSIRIRRSALERYLEKQTRMRS